MVLGHAAANGHRSTPAPRANGNASGLAPRSTATPPSNNDSIVPAAGATSDANGNTNATATSPSPSPEVSSRQSALLQSMRGDTAFCDAVLVVGTHETPVHRAVLSQLSPFFRKILQQCAAAAAGNVNGFNGTAAAGIPRITLQHATIASARILVDYAYGLDVRKSCQNNIDTALDVANLAATLTIRGLCNIAINSAMRCARAHDYPRVYYAFKLFGRDLDADKVLRCMARDGNLWNLWNLSNSNTNTNNGNRNNININGKTRAGIDRMAPNDLLKLVLSPELTASEDDLFISLVNWVSVDPQVRAQQFMSNFLPLIRFQRLTHRCHTHLMKLARVASIPPTLLAGLLADTLAKATSTPAGCDLGANVIVAKTHALANGNGNTNSNNQHQYRDNSISLLGCSLEWLNEIGRREFKLALAQPIPRTYPVVTIHAQHYLLSVYDVIGSANANVSIGDTKKSTNQAAKSARVASVGCSRDYYVDFISLCVHFKVVIDENQCLLYIEIERRNKMTPQNNNNSNSPDNDNNNNHQFPSLDDSLSPAAILCETTVAFLPGTPFQCAFGAWPARELVLVRSPDTDTSSGPPAKKRQRTDAGNGNGNCVGRMELVGSDGRRKKILSALQNGVENALTVSVCLRTTKMSLLKEKGFLNEKKGSAA